MKCPRFSIFIVLLTLICSVIPNDAYAYLDPGTGSYLIQILLASLLGAVFAIKVFWKKIIARFERLFSKENKNVKDRD